jgi:uncharacterized protein
MMKKRITLLFLGSMVAWAAIVQARQVRGSDEDSTITRAKTFVDLLAHHEIAACVGYFDSTMKAVLPEEKLKGAWDSVLVRVGPYKKQLRTWTQRLKMYDIVMVTCLFERDSADVRVVIDEKHRVAGLFFSKSLNRVEYTTPPYAKQEKFREEAVLVGSGRWALHGTLSMPAGSTSCPAIVLVHGSGPNDRDETIGPNKPFRDLAWGLASNGIAVLRYEKRTREHGSELVVLKQAFTVKDETIEDALLAVELLRKTPGIDPKRIFVLGHSLGGMLAPRIGKGDSSIAGLIILAGATRRLEDIMVDQVTYLSSFSPLAPQKRIEQLTTIEKERDKVRKLTTADLSSTDSYFAAPASYWIDLQGYSPPQAALSLKMPMLILQGERDYQVTMQDYEGWTKALSGRKGVTFKTYPKLNHLFIAGEGKSLPNEYERAGHVQYEVVDDILRWVKSR